MNKKTLEPILYQSCTDKELLEYLKTGIKPAFNELVERWKKKLYNKTYKSVQNSILASSIVQEIFDDLWRLDSRLQIEDLHHYLSTSVKHHVYLLYQKKMRHLPNEDPLNHFAMAVIQAESALNIEDLKILIKRWLPTQPKERIEIFKLKYQVKFSSKEISNKLGISIKAVQDQINISRISLNDYVHKFLTANLD